MSKDHAKEIYVTIYNKTPYIQFYNLRLILYGNVVYYVTMQYTYYVNLNSYCKMTIKKISDGFLGLKFVL